MQVSRGNRFRFPAIAGLALFLLMVSGFVLDIAIIGTTGGDPQIRVDQLGPDLVRVKGSTIWPVEGWIYTLMILPAFVFLAGVHWAFRRVDEDGVAAIGVVVTATFWALSTAHNLAILTVVQSLAPVYVPGAPEAVAIEAVSRSLVWVADALSPLSGLGAVFLIVGALALGRATLTSKELPRWTGYIALSSALLLGLGTFQHLSRPLIAVSLIGFILYMVWVAGMSVTLLRRWRGASASDGG